ncbi:hypothetical protein [Thermomonospora echinospora]|uniref:hypothetical protein n=1 Tax=Thermomonospora echinospora TaxID=1992 RepID=UPI0011B0A649|nr:hypothetical protein [Thermomonospora echinospora]
MMLFEDQGGSAVWADLQIAVIGVIGAAMTFAGVQDLLRSRPIRPSRQLADHLIVIILGLWFLFCFTSVAFFGLRFTPASPLQVAIIALVWIARKIWSLWRERARSTGRSFPLGREPGKL